MMKVHGIMVQPSSRWGAKSRQVRVIVATSSQVKAVEAIQRAGISNMTIGHLRTYGSVTENPAEVEVALAVPGQVFWSEDRMSRAVADYHPVDEGEL